MTGFFSWHPFLFQRYSSYANLVTNDIIGCASTVVWHKIKNISANIEAMLLKLIRDVAPYKIYQMIHIFMLLLQHARFQSPAPSKLNITICDSARQNTWSYLRLVAVPPSLSPLFNIFGCIWCPVQLQIIIFDFEEAGDWNRACCHSNIKMCTIWYIMWGATSLLSFNSIASILAEIFLILCLTTVLAQPMTSPVTKFA